MHKQRFRLAKNPKEGFAGSHQRSVNPCYSVGRGLVFKLLQSTNYEGSDSDSTEAIWRYLAETLDCP